jgi:acyl-CoA hydrolase
MMDPTSLYRAMLTTPAEAVGRIASGVNLSMTEPPALLKGLADRVACPPNTGPLDRGVFVNALPHFNRGYGNHSRPNGPSSGLLPIFWST